MKKFWMLWTYLGNYSTKPWVHEAETPEKAAEWLWNGFSADFREKGKVYVFDREPVLVKTGPKHD